MIRMLTVFLFLPIALAGTVPADDATSPDFTGSWVLDPAASDDVASVLGKAMSGATTYTLDGDTLVVTRTIRAPGSADGHRLRFVYRRSGQS